MILTEQAVNYSTERVEHSLKHRFVYGCYSTRTQKRITRTIWLEKKEDVLKLLTFWNCEEWIYFPIQLDSFPPF